MDCMGVVFLFVGYIDQGIFFTEGEGGIISLESYGQREGMCINRSKKTFVCNEWFMRLF